MGEPAAGRRLEVVVFEVGGRRYGLPVSEVRELLRVVTIVPVPLASRAIEGVINLRGAVVPVLDIRALLGLPAAPAEPDDQMIVLDVRGRTAAIRVDRVHELMAPEADDLADAGGFLSAADDVAGVARSADGLVLMLNPGNLATLAGSAAIGGEGGGP